MPVEQKKQALNSEFSLIDVSHMSTRNFEGIEKNKSTLFARNKFLANDRDRDFLKSILVYMNGFSDRYPKGQSITHHNYGKNYRT